MLTPIPTLPAQASAQHSTAHSTGDEGSTGVPPGSSAWQKGSIDAHTNPHIASAKGEPFVGCTGQLECSSSAPGRVLAGVCLPACQPASLQATTN